jgi:hypothetical protein
MCPEGAVEGVEAFRLVLRLKRRHLVEQVRVAADGALAEDDEVL